jgi:hypothetical protein
MFSREIGVDKQRVYRYIKTKNIQVNVIDGIIYIDDVVQTKLKSEIIKKSDAVKKHRKSTSSMLKSGISKDIFKELKDTIKILNKELEIKTEQLQEKDRQITELIKIINQRKREGS